MGWALLVVILIIIVLIIGIIIVVAVVRGGNTPPPPQSAVVITPSVNTTAMFTNPTVSKFQALVSEPNSQVHYNNSWQNYQNEIVDVVKGPNRTLLLDERGNLIDLHGNIVMIGVLLAAFSNDQTLYVVKKNNHTRLIIMSSDTYKPTDVVNIESDITFLTRINNVRVWCVTRTNIAHIIENETVVSREVMPPDTIKIFYNSDVYFEYNLQTMSGKIMNGTRITESLDRVQAGYFNGLHFTYTDHPSVQILHDNLVVYKNVKA